MVSVRIEIGLRSRVGPDSVWGPEVVREQAGRDETRPLRGKDTHHEKVPGIRGGRPPWPFLTVDREGVEIHLGQPEVTIHRDAERGGPPPRILREVGPTLLARKRGKGHVGRVHVSLDLHQGDGRAYGQMVFRAILPSLMEESVRVLSFVFGVSVRGTVPAAHDPPVRVHEGIPQFRNEA